MNKNTLTAIIAGLLVVCVTALGIAFIVSGGTEDTPAPVATTSAPAPSPVETSDPILDLLEDTWDQQSASDQQNLCWLFNYDADAAFDAFDGGSEGLVPEDTFMEFFDGECATI